MNTAISIQDYEIRTYEVDIQKCSLILHTVSPDAKRADVCFGGVYAHDFNNVQTDKNVLSEIMTMEYPQFKAQHIEEMPVWLAGFSIEEADLEKHVRKGKLKIYEVRAKDGLRGIVVAREMEIKNSL